MSNESRKKNKDLRKKSNKARAILESTNVEIQTINEYKQLKAELNKHHLSSEEPERLVTILNTMKHCRYDPKKIVAEFARLEFSERIRKNT